MPLLAARFPKTVTERCIIVSRRAAFSSYKTSIREISSVSDKGLLPFGQFSAPEGLPKAEFLLLYRYHNHFSHATLDVC